MTNLQGQREATLDAIDRRRDECSATVPDRAALDGAASSPLRTLASSIRATAWGDKTESAEEAGEFSDDPGWAPSAALRVAALVDHLSELASASGSPLTIPMLPNTTSATAPSGVAGAWARTTTKDLAARLEALVGAAEVVVFDAADGAMIARATSWRGEVVEVVELSTLTQRRQGFESTLQGSASKDEKKKATAEITRLSGKEGAWADALVRAGFSRAHLGAELTAEFFQRHVVERRRLDVTVDVNAIAHGLVHHLSRLAPHVDYARSAITDLEIQRLADHDRGTWRKACRALESFPVDGPAWRSLGLPDTTALLVARADQGGKKAPGADALLAHNFEDALVRAHGVQAVLLTSDNGLARTIAARLRRGAVWVGYVDPPSADQRYVSPILSWPKGSISESRYCRLAELLDELLVCGVAEHLIASDGTTTIELRAHLEGEHQYVDDWHAPHLFARGFGSPSVRAPSGAWPLKELSVPRELKSSGARVTVDQVATALEWVRSSNAGQLGREQVPLVGDAKSEAWNFLRAVDVVDNEGRLLGHGSLVAAAAERDIETVRTIVLRFEPVARIVAAIGKGHATIASAKKESDLGERTFGAALGLSIACGLTWRIDDTLGLGIAFRTRKEFREWLLAAVAEPVRIAALAERVARELSISPARFRDALAVLVDDPELVGARGGSVESSPLDTRNLTIDDKGRFAVQELNVDDLLGLKSLAVRS